MRGDLQQRLAGYFAGHPAGVISAYLFGSHAEGRAHRESDVDVGVLLDRTIFPTREQRADLRIDLTSALVGALHFNDVQVVLLNDAPPELGRHVVTRGVRVWVADTEADHAFVRDIQLRAADLAPFLRKMRRLKLRALRS